MLGAQPGRAPRSRSVAVEPSPAGEADSREDVPERAGRSRVSVKRRPSPAPRTRWISRQRSRAHSGLLRWLPAVVAAALVVALVVVDLSIYPSWHSQPSKAERRERLLASVNSAVAKVLSYDYRHIDQDATAAAANLTGKFRDDYTKSMATTVKRDAPGVKAVVTGEVGSSGIASVSADGNQAVVLVLGQQTVSNTSLSTPRLDSVSLRVTLARVGGKWLIAKLDQL
jgi:Mce-associated membrane protein